MRTTLPSTFPRRWSFPTRKDTSFTEIQIALMMIILRDFWFVFLLQPVLCNICVKCYGSDAFISPRSGIRIRDLEWKNSDTGFGIRDEHPRTFSRRLRNSFSGLKYLKFFDADPDPGPRIQDPGWKNSDPGSGKNIPDLQHCLVSIIHMVLEDGLIEDVFLK
jgi:hypothetical protein